MAYELSPRLGVFSHGRLAVENLGYICEGELRRLPGDFQAQGEICLTLKLGVNGRSQSGNQRRR